MIWCDLLNIIPLVWCRPPPPWFPGPCPAAWPPDPSPHLSSVSLWLSWSWLDQTTSLLEGGRLNTKSLQNAWMMQDSVWSKCLTDWYFTEWQVLRILSSLPMKHQGVSVLPVQFEFWQRGRAKSTCVHLSHTVPNIHSQSLGHHVD